MSLCAVNCDRTMAHGPTETDEEFDARYVAFFNRKDIDGWEIRKVRHYLALGTFHV